MASPQEIGQILREKRASRSLSLEEAAFTTHIRAYYLKAIEDGDFDKLPSPSQGKGFIRLYAGFLGVEVEPLLTGEPTGKVEAAATPSEPVQTLPEKAVENNAQADAIFTEIGHKLRRHREMLGISLEEVEQHTRLRSHYLKALESGDFDKLPSPVQGRGMLSNYTEFLGLDSNQVLLRYAEGLQAQLMARKEAELEFEKSKKTRKSRSKGRKAEETSPRPVGVFNRLLSPDSLFGAILVLSLIGFIIWGTTRIVNVRSQSESQTSTPTAPSIADVLLGAGTDTPSEEGLATQAPMLPSPSATVAPPEELPLETEAGLVEEEITSTVDTALTGTPPSRTSAYPVEVYIAIRQRAWVRVIVDGEIAFDDRVYPGSIYQYSAKEVIEVITGNAAALQVFYNQVDQGVLGNLGEVVDIVYGASGAATPTPTVTPTGGPTGRVPLTPTPSPTVTRP